MNPSPESPEDRDLKLLQPTSATVAAGTTGGAGVLSLLNGVQLLIFLQSHKRGVAFVPYMFVALGVALIFLAWNMRAVVKWATAAAVALTTLLFVAGCVWFWYALFHGFVAFFGIVTPAFSMLAIVVAGVSLPACGRAEAARARLRSQGIATGF